VEAEIAEPSAEYLAFAQSFELSLEARNRAKATVVVYMDAVMLLGRFLAARGLPTAIAEIKREHIELFIADLLARRSPSTAVNRFKSLQQFFRFLVDEDELTVSPMARMTPPSVPESEIPVPTQDDLRRLLKACVGKDFNERRDTAIVMLLLDTGARRAEAAGLKVTDIDLRVRTAFVVGKGSRGRTLPLGARTTQALDRYLRVRARHKLAYRDELWLGPSGPVTGWGIADIIERRSRQAGIKPMHPHQLRHYFAHTWRMNGGDDAALMSLAGWRSRDMLNRYGRSVAAERARDTHRRLSPGDNL
jgi:site-specific recombinase XerD